MEKTETTITFEGKLEVDCSYDGWDFDIEGTDVLYEIEKHFRQLHAGSGNQVKSGTYRITVEKLS